MICNDGPGDAQIVHTVDGGCDGGGVNHIVAVDLGSSQQCFFHHGVFLAMRDQGMNDVGTVDIEEEQHGKGDQYIQHGITHLRVAIAAVFQTITF